MRRTLRVSAALLALSALAVWTLVAVWWVENDARLALYFPLSSGGWRAGCASFGYWGASTMVLPWILAVMLPCILVPRRAPIDAAEEVNGETPYRANGLRTTRNPDPAEWLRHRRTRRALIASATGACLVACGCIDPLVMFPREHNGPLEWPLIPNVNGVAVLDHVIAAAIIFVYGRAARGKP